MMTVSKQWLAVLAGFAGIAIITSQTISIETGPVASNPENQGHTKKEHSNTQQSGNYDSVSVNNSALTYSSKYGTLPDTLTGTTMLQPLVTDEEGHLRISSDIRQIFDYFLSAIDEESIDIIIGRINEYLENSLTEPALSEARSILADYIGLKQALYDYEMERSPDLETRFREQTNTKNKDFYLTLLEEQLSERNQLRKQHLAPEIHEAFYGSEEAYDEYTLSRMKVLADNSLSDQQKQQALTEIDAVAPVEIITARKEVQILDELKVRMLNLEKQGATTEDIRQLRTEMFGQDAASRFDQLDEERKVWKSRINEYLVQRESILSAEGVSAEEREMQVKNLRSSLFDAREQIRVMAYERKSET